jgi:hypothetical protein
MDLPPGSVEKRVAQIARHLLPRVVTVAQQVPTVLDQLRHLSATDEVGDQFAPSRIAYVTQHEALSSETLQAGVLLVAHPRADVRRRFIDRVCRAAVERSLLVYAISPPGSATVSVSGVFRLTTHTTLSRRAILSALLRHGAHVLMFGLVSTRDDVSLLMEAAYTGYQTVAEVVGETPEDVIARLEAIGVDTTMLPQNLRIIVPEEAQAPL